MVETTTDTMERATRLVLGRAVGNLAGSVAAELGWSGAGV
jgi:hypothetical protein